MKYIYSSCFASFLFDEDFKMLREKRFCNLKRSNKDLEGGRWLNEERELIEDLKNEKIVLIGFKNEEIDGIIITQDVLSKISGLLRCEIKEYYVSNNKLTKENLNLFLKEDEELKEDFECRCKNIHSLLGKDMGLELIKLAGSLKRFASMPSSKIQLLGAEKAFFRHLKYKTGLPKHGIIYNHEFILSAKEKGKAARLLADKIAIAARVDYFKGKFVGDKLKKGLMEKIG